MLQDCSEKVTPDRGARHLSFGSKKSNAESFGAENTGEKR